MKLHVVFNVRELEDMAVRSVARNKVVCAEGIAKVGLNKFFLLTMDGGFEIMAK